MDQVPGLVAGVLHLSGSYSRVVCASFSVAVKHLILDSPWAHNHKTVYFQGKFTSVNALPGRLI